MFSTLDSSLFLSLYDWGLWCVVSRAGLGWVGTPNPLLLRETGMGEGLERDRLSLNLRLDWGGSPGEAPRDGLRGRQGGLPVTHRDGAAALRAQGRGPPCPSSSALCYFFG